MKILDWPSLEQRIRECLRRVDEGRLTAMQGITWIDEILASETGRGSEIRRGRLVPVSEHDDIMGWAWHEVDSDPPLGDRLRPSWECQHGKRHPTGEVCDCEGAPTDG